MDLDHDDEPRRISPPPDDPPAREDPEDRVGTFDEHCGVTTVIRAAEYRFDAVASTIQTVVLADSVDIVRARQATMLLIVHSRTGMSATASFSVKFFNALYDPLGAGPTLLDPNPIAVSKGITSTFPLPTPFCDLVDVTNPGEQVRAALEWKQGGTAASGAQVIRLSLYIAWRTRQ